MANPEHLAILKQGVDKWSKWRYENEMVRPDISQSDLREATLYGADLRNANLSSANLIGADLGKVNLSGSDLSRADLSRSSLRKAKLQIAYLTGSILEGADLSESDFSKADLSRSDLREANLYSSNLCDAILRGADLRNANLSSANLTGADLSRADLVGADLSNANLKNAIIWHSVFADVDLSEAINLDTIRYEGPSTIGIDTLYKSKGNISEVFLRSCGVPNNFIEYARSLIVKPIEYYSCFISYGCKDEEFAKRIHNDLQAAGVRCWFAPQDMKIGDKIRSTINDSIRVHDKLLLILSEHSVQSDWVEHEVEHALDLEKERKQLVLFPIRLDDVVMYSNIIWAVNLRQQRHIGDFIHWNNQDAYRKAFSRLLLDLKADVSTESGGRL